MLGHHPVEAEVRHRGDGDRVDPECECEHSDDLITVDGLAPLVHGEHPVAVAVERHPEVEGARAHDLLQHRQVGGAAGRR